MRAPSYNGHVMNRSDLVDFAEWYFENVKVYDTLKNLLKYANGLDLVPRGAPFRLDKVSSKSLAHILARYPPKGVFDHAKYCWDGRHLSIWSLKGNLPPKRKAFHPWKPWELRFVKEHYKLMPDSKISKFVNHPTNSIGVKRKEMHWMKDDYYNKAVEAGK